MARVNVFDECGELEGWFDEAKAEEFKEATRWDGSNHISIATGSQWDHQALYRTAGGRWVLHRWSQWQGRPETYQFVTEKEAETWLLANSEDEAVERFFGEIEEERGPGRPEIGPAIGVRLTEEMLGQLDAAAKVAEVSRAEIIRRLLEKALVKVMTSKHFCPDCGAPLTKSEYYQSILDEVSLGGADRDREMLICQCDFCGKRSGVVLLVEEEE